ncbi:MAG: hypothetical protein ACTIH7_14980 [Brevibacterium aurantiacum]
MYKTSGRPFVRSQNVGWGDLRLDDLAFLDEATHSTFTGSEIRVGDVLLNITGASIGRSAVAIPALDGGNVNQHVCEVRLKSSMNPDFVCAVLNSQIGQRQIDTFQAGGNRQGLNFKQVGSIRVPRLGISDQNAVASAINHTDDLIASLRRLIAKKRAVKQGMMQELLTGRTRLPGFDGEWHAVTLGEHVRYMKTVALSRAQLNATSPTRYLHYGDIHTRGNSALDTSVEMMPRVSKGLIGNAGYLQKGDLVFADASEDPDGVGKSVEITGVPSEGVVPGLHTIAARFDKRVLADGFKGYLQFIDAFRSQLLALASGTKVLATTRSYISRIELTLPGIAEQVAISEVLRDADAEIEALERRLEATRDIKQGMMQELLTGRTRLPVDEEVAV